MRSDGRMIAAALLGAALASAGGARAQDPVPLPPLPPPAMPGVVPVAPPVSGPVQVHGPAPAQAQPFPGGTAVPPPPGPVIVPHEGPIHGRGSGPIGRAVHHVGFTIKDRMVGEPERFYEPPVGWSVGRNFGAQVAMAEQHRYTLYRSDFFAGTDRLTPEGVRRLGRMVARWDCWAGPLLVEFDPNRPGLAEARRVSVLELTANHGTFLDPDRLIIGGSPYLGGRGDLSELYEGVLLDRSIRAPTLYPLNPIPNADFGN